MSAISHFLLSLPLQSSWIGTCVWQGSSVVSSVSSSKQAKQQSTYSSRAKSPDPLFGAIQRCVCARARACACACVSEKDGQTGGRTEGQTDNVYFCACVCMHVSPSFYPSLPCPRLSSFPLSSRKVSGCHGHQLRSGAERASEGVKTRVC